MIIDRPQPDSNDEDRLIPLINIVFLILIFFMITGQIANQEPVPVDLPFSESDPKREQGAFILVIDQAGNLYIDGNPSSLPQATEQMFSWQQGLQPGQQRILTIKSDAGLDGSRLMTYLQAFKALPWDGIQLAVNI